MGPYTRITSACGREELSFGDMPTVIVQECTRAYPHIEPGNVGLTGSFRRGYMQKQ